MLAFLPGGLGHQEGAQGKGFPPAPQRERGQVLPCNMCKLSPMPFEYPTELRQGMPARHYGQ